MIINLSQKYVCCFGKPIIDSVDSEIFLRTYFFDCLNCGFCNDMCCNYGVDIDIENYQRIQKFTEQLEDFTKIKKENWFKDEIIEDDEFPGGAYLRTQVSEGKCVFWDKKNRGCMIHSFCNSIKMDFHLLKPIVSTLFPITFDNGLLHPSSEVDDNTLVCLNVGVSLYRGIRNDLLFYFGQEFIDELDNIESQLK
jgi:hypothetical protein